MQKEIIEEVPEGQAPGPLDCPKCGETMTLMGATPSLDQKIVTLWLACESCMISCQLPAKICNSRVCTDRLGKMVVEK